jgi:hypothetical protein
MAPHYGLTNVRHLLDRCPLRDGRGGHAPERLHHGRHASSSLPRACALLSMVEHQSNLPELLLSPCSPSTPSSLSSACSRRARPRPPGPSGAPATAVPSLHPSLCSITCTDTSASSSSMAGAPRLSRSPPEHAITLAAIAEPSRALWPTTTKHPTTKSNHHITSLTSRRTSRAPRIRPLSPEHHHRLPPSFRAAGARGQGAIGGLRGSYHLPWMRADHGITTASPLTAGAAPAGRSRKSGHLPCPAV